MGQATNGAPSAADILKVADAYGAWLKAGYAALGLGSPSETGTLAAKALLARTVIMGDGSATYPGLQNAALQQRLLESLNLAVLQSAWPAFFSLLCRQPFADLDNFVLANLPQRTALDGWRFSSPDALRGLDLHLTRMNGNSPDAPAKPSWTPVLTPTTGGSIAPTTAGQEPRVKVAYVGRDSNGNTADWLESLPSSASAQAALSGKNNAWLLADPGGNVPAGVAKLRIYRQLDGNGGVNDPFHWDQDIAVTPAQAWSAYLPALLTNPDQLLRQDWNPASWLQCLLLPEEAALYALAYGAAAGFAGGAPQTTLLSFLASAMLSPGNVALNPANGFLGMGNPSSTGEFGRWVGGAGYTEGAIRLANEATLGIQGFCGAAGGVRARTISALNSAASLSDLRYYYYDAANPTTLQNITVTPGGTLGTGVGSTLDIAVTAGRLVTRIDQVTVSGAATGSFVFEAIPLRSI